MTDLRYIVNVTPSGVTREPIRKLGRQGYALILGKDFVGGWYWTIETQNGVEVASSSLSYRDRYDAVRSATRLLGNKLSVVYVEDENGVRDELSR